MKESKLARVARQIGLPPEDAAEVERQIVAYIDEYKAKFRKFWDEKPNGRSKASRKKPKPN